MGTSLPQGSYIKPLSFFPLLPIGEREGGGYPVTRRKHPNRFEALAEDPLKSQNNFD
jgi:hypothetical protein